jgi:Zn-dependent protease
MGGWWISELMNNESINGQVWVVSWVVWVVISICLHELAHGWTAIRFGDLTPRHAGHMTWNPMVHMGMMSFGMLLFLGIAWGAMPVDTTRLRGKFSETLVLAAGPGMNLLLAVVSLLLLILWRPLAAGELVGSVQIGDPLAENLAVFFFLGAKLNIVLMLFNLIPVPPLDGGRILMDRWAWFRGMMYTENGRWFSLIAFIFIFMTAGKFLFLAGELAAFIPAELAWDSMFPNLNSWDWGYHSP